MHGLDYWLKGGTVMVGPLPWFRRFFSNLFQKMFGKIFQKSGPVPRSRFMSDLKPLVKKWNKKKVILRVPYSFANKVFENEYGTQ